MFTYLRWKRTEKTLTFFAGLYGRHLYVASTELLCKIRRHPIFGSNSQEGLPSPLYFAQLTNGQNTTMTMMNHPLHLRGPHRYRRKLAR